ncbi:thioredoxin family protein [Plantactinospora sp. B5E13]|uniref:TlpA family protein disulfide reductase n=1 Tax=unclassified Plantactinospora TaxID=2631981 RepID=UPI00325FB240
MVATLVAATGFGLWHRRRDGVLRPVASATAVSGGIASAAATTSGTASSVTATAVSGGTVPADGVGGPAVDRGGAGGEPPDDPDLRAMLTALGVRLGTPATLLQFSSAFCAPCRTTRRVLSDVVELLDGVRHVEVDAESELAAVRTLAIWRTPTVLVIDAEGRVVRRATGVPSKAQVIATVAPLLDKTTP